MLAGALPRSLGTDDEVYDFMRRSCNRCNTPATDRGAVKEAADEIARASAADGEQAELFGPAVRRSARRNRESARSRGQGRAAEGAKIATGMS